MGQEKVSVSWAGGTACAHARGSKANRENRLQCGWSRLSRLPHRKPERSQMWTVRGPEKERSETIEHLSDVVIAAFQKTSLESPPGLFGES